MPYIIKKTKEKGKVGYKVCKRDEPERCFSKHPLTEKKALKQRTAIVLSELGRSIKRGGVEGDENTPETGETTPPANNQMQTPPAPTRNPTRVLTNRPRMATGAPRALFMDTEGHFFFLLPTPQTEASSPSPQAGPSSPQAGPSTADYTLEQCRQFFNKIDINPKTGRKIKRYETVFNNIINTCKKIMPEDEFMSGVQKAKLRAGYVAGLVGQEATVKIKNVEFTEETCIKFAKDQGTDPKTDSIIDISSARYKTLRQKCKETLPKEQFDALEKEYIDSIILNNKYGAKKCAAMINNMDIKYDVNDRKLYKDIKYLSVGNFYSPNKKNIDMNHPLVNLLLKKCEDNFLMRPIVLRLIDRSDVNTQHYHREYLGTIEYLVKQLETGPDNFKIEYSRRINDTIDTIATFIINYNLADINPDRKIQLLEGLMDEINYIINNSTSDETAATNGKKIFINETVRENLQACLLEIVALTRGLRIDIISDDTDSSSRKSTGSQSSESRSIPENLPVLPKKKRAELLEELEKSCIEMRDIITLDDFKDMKKKKLQLIVKIGPVTRFGKQACYYVKNIFNSVKTNINLKQVPVDPATRQVITADDMEKIILPKMKYIDVKVINPFIKQEVNRRIPNIELTISQIIDTRGREYYKIGYRRKLAGQIQTTNLQGYIPMNIYINEGDRGDMPPHDTDVFTNSTDVSSTVIISKLAQLNERGLLVDVFGTPRVHINKPLDYWYDTSDQIIKKTKLMIDEFENILR